MITDTLNLFFLLGEIAYGLCRLSKEFTLQRIMLFFYPFLIRGSLWEEKWIFGLQLRKFLCWSIEKNRIHSQYFHFYRRRYDGVLSSITAQKQYKSYR